MRLFEYSCIPNSEKHPGWHFAKMLITAEKYQVFLQKDPF